MRVNLTWQGLTLTAAILATLGLIAWLIVEYATGNTAGGDTAGAVLLIYLMVAVPVWIAHRVGRGQRQQTHGQHLGAEIREDTHAISADMREAGQALNEMRQALGRDIPEIRAGVQELRGSVERQSREMHELRDSIAEVPEMHELVSALHERLVGEATVHPMRRGNGDG
ncbi:MAG: hypothetical protein ACRDMV_03865 [Streptosporangiales bacterium]